MHFKSLVLPLLLAAPALAAEPVPIPNPSFENDLQDWSLDRGQHLVRIAADRVAHGKKSLLIDDNDPKDGCLLHSQPIPVKPNTVYQLRGQYFALAGKKADLQIGARILDKHHNILDPGDANQRKIGGGKEWLPFGWTFYTPQKAAFIQIRIGSNREALVQGHLDDLALLSYGNADAPPWTPQYKRKPSDHVTPADVPGPDGLVYPNWTRCGVEGGIPENLLAPTPIADFGALPDDNKDDAPALENAADHLAKTGGVILLAPGTYHLDRPVTIRHDNIVLRGSGLDQTKILFRYAINNGLDFYAPKPNQRVGKNTPIEIHADPQNGKLLSVEVLCNGKSVHLWNRRTHSGNTFNTKFTGEALIGKFPDGPLTLHAIARYTPDASPTERTADLPILLDANHVDPAEVPVSTIAIGFVGQGRQGATIPLAADGRRGDTFLTVQSAATLAVGDHIYLEAPATPAWNTRVRNAAKWGSYRMNQYRIEKIDGDKIHIGQPLRIDFPVADDAFVQKTIPIQRCGIEHLTIEQTENLWITAAQFSEAWNCWARSVKVIKCGRHPVQGIRAKFCEIRDCIFDDAWFKGGGGTAYAGFTSCWDSLMENVTTYKLRHGPLFQWASSGNVIRNSTFHQSDAQWHAGWTHENLIENCTVTSVRGHGGYGVGMWASPPDDEAHGPNGPRNVIYNCDVSAQRNGVWLGGMNEAWMFLHNRFTVDAGPGFIAQAASFDHTLRDNVFILKDKNAPMVHLLTPDCVGADILGNALHGGNGKLLEGPAKPNTLKDNTTSPSLDAPRPTPAVPSIYDWQQQNAVKNTR